jgi:hypothetical protein
VASRYSDWFGAIRRVRASYRARFGRSPNLLFPRSYSEKMQWRKLFDLNPLFGVFSDKIAVRDFIAARIGTEHLIPVLWIGTDPELIPFDRLEPPYVIKSSHAAGHTILVARGERPDAASVRQRVRAWLGHCHGTSMVEPGYVNVPRRIMIERAVLTAEGDRPRELCLFVFGGRVCVVQTRAIEKGRLVNLGFNARDWTRLRWWLTTPFREEPPQRAKRLYDMIALAERLGQGLDHLRVDFYDCGDTIWIGELTVYCWSGMVPFHPEGTDRAFGAYWRLAWPLPRAIAAVLLRRRGIRAPRVGDASDLAVRARERGTASYLWRRPSAAP